MDPPRPAPGTLVVGVGGAEGPGTHRLTDVQAVSRKTGEGRAQQGTCGVTKPATPVRAECGPAGKAGRKQEGAPSEEGAT